MTSNLPIWQRITRRPTRAVSTREPRYVREYADQLQEIGPTAFKHHYKRAVLVGLGITAYVDERPPQWTRRTLPMSPYKEIAAVQSILDRVWPVRKDPGAPRGPRIMLGNSSLNDIVLPDYTISHHHCAFAFEPGRILVTDLGSFNGTELNGEPLAPEVSTPLVDRSTLVVGRVMVQYLTRQSFFELAAEQAQLG